MTEQPKASALKGASNLAQIGAFITIQVLAALTLDGWLSIALWALAARNAVLLGLTLWGVLDMAAKAHDKERQP